MEKRLAASESHFFKPLTPQGTSSGGRCKNDTYSVSPCPPKAPALEEDGKRFSASENYFFKPLPPKATALEEDGKTIFGKRKSRFKPLPHQGTSPIEKDGITIIGFRQAKITFSSPYPAKAPVLKKDGKTIIGKRKSLVSTCPFQGT